MPPETSGMMPPACSSNPSPLARPCQPLQPDSTFISAPSPNLQRCSSLPCVPGQIFQPLFRIPRGKFRIAGPRQEDGFLRFNAETDESSTKRVERTKPVLLVVSGTIASAFFPNVCPTFWLACLCATCGCVHPWLPSYRLAQHLVALHRDASRASASARQPNVKTLPRKRGGVSPQRSRT